VTGFPLVHEFPPGLTIERVLRGLADWPDPVLFDTAQARPEVGRYSFFSADPVEFHEWRPPARAAGSGPALSATPTADPLAGLAQAFSTWQTPAVPGLPPFQGGVAGVLGYELGGAWERIPPAAIDDLAFPPLVAGLYDWVIAWDHLQDRAWLISQGLPEHDPGRRASRARDRQQSVLAALARPEPRLGTLPVSADDAELAANRHDVPGVPGLRSSFSREDYLASVRRCIDYIHAGDCFQVNLSQRLSLPCRLPPLELYLRLRRCNPAPFAGLMQHGDWCVASSSPERFLSVRERRVETRPIKGTRRRQQLPEADLFAGDELRRSEKDQAENVMIVDLLRNDLSRVCEPGSIVVPHLCRVETYETVQHLVSVVQGRLAPSADGWGLIRATFPGGSITGAPKVRAMEIIAELEPTVRGPYCGSLFYLGCDGSFDSSILIRTMLLRKGWAVFGVGGGVVAQSDPLAEYTETLHKASGLLRVFGMA
jgi:para-aminobenzoate synthetase component 1